MKKCFLVSIFAMLFAFAANAQTSGITFENSVHDFGTIQEKDGVVTATFEFTNTGDAPLVINGVSASCGCTTPDWTKEPIAPNAKGFVKAAYNPKGRPGQFTKSVTVRSNASDQPVVLQIKGEVILEAKQ